MKQENKDVRSEREKPKKQPARQDRIARAAKYNYKDMKDETIQAHHGFAKRLASIRAIKGISAREMSLSLGQGAGYINNIENGKNLPSMSMFFEICEYLGLSPREFFDYPVLHKGNTRQMLTAFEQLDQGEQELIIRLTERLKKV